MAPFESPILVCSGIKERAESLLIQGDRLYAGTAAGNVHVYSTDDEPEGATLVESRKGLSKRAIEQLGYIRDINSLVVLADRVPTLYPLPSFAPPTPLIKAKTAFSFGIHTSIHHDQPPTPSGESPFDKGKPIPTIVTQLLVGCQRKAVLYSWKDGEPQDTKESPLPHSPRAVAFLDHDNVVFAYPNNEYAVFSISKLTTLEVTTPMPAAPSMGALSGFTGYMTLGLGAKAKPGLVRLSDGEALIVKDNQGFVIGADGRPLRDHTLHWPSPPEELAYVKPYILSALAPGTVSASSDEKNPTAASTQSTMIQSAVIQISSYLTASTVQTLLFPSQQVQVPAPTTSAGATHTIRLLTSSPPSSKSSIYFIATPTDRTTASTEGSSVWQLRMRSWMDQIDELVTCGLYADALSLLHTLDPSILPDKDQRQTKIQALHAVSQFRAGKYDDAINTFLELDLNPAKVVALYPESIAGRLSVSQDEWIPLFGGPANPKPAENDDANSAKSTDTANANSGKDKALTAALERSPSPTSSLRLKSKSTFASLLPSMAKDDDAASISGRRPKKPVDEFSRSVDALWRYLTDRRPKVAPALAAVNITSAQSHSLPFLSETSVDELFAIPNVPLSSLTPEQLIRFAQIVDTALFKSYLHTRPSMLGPLCRVSNWCEVSEVEEELRAREKFAELIDLYHGKKMHSKALSLLKELSAKEDDPRDKLSPSIAYLRKLGPEHQDQVFEWSRWIFDEDKEQAFEIFTSDDVELPFEAVTDYLEKTDPKLAARYIEYVIDEKGEEGSHFHNRLAELYLNITVAARKDDDTRSTFYEKLLTFLDSTFFYQPDRLYGLVPDNLYEARAILLGRMGRHGHALELYVYRLQDYPKAEEYCKRVYAAGPETANIFLTLLRIYLRPTVKTSADLLKPALDLISRHSPRLDSVETLQLLPPLVTAKDVRPYLFDALRAPIFDTHVVRDIHKARTESVAQKLMLLESRRVRITDSRICPQCHKRIGNSVIAVHAPRGEVTHYQCREAFSRKLTDSLRR